MRSTKSRTIIVAASVLIASAIVVVFAWPTQPSPVRINHIQVVGTHNSYHLQVSERELAIRSLFTSRAQTQALEYDHLPLTRQLAEQKVRQVELDVFADPDGGLYAKPLLRSTALQGAHDPAMNAAGTKVLHLQDVDYQSNCLTLKQCLTSIKSWSEANPSHVPISILLQLSDAPIARNDAPYSFTQPIKWDAGQMDALDSEIEAVFAPEDLITPDDVRGKRTTLEQAVLQDGWPTLDSARGKVLFLMDNEGEARANYLEGHPNLERRPMFTNSKPGQPDAAFVKENDPTGQNHERIQDEVRSGYIVRTRADVDTVQARTGDTSMRDLALSSGAQLVSTDYPADESSAHFGTGYVVQLPDGRVARCNPVSAPTSCKTDRLEASGSGSGSDSRN